MATIPYRDCAHHYVVDDSRLPEMAVRCSMCGDRVVTAQAECAHERVLALPAFHFAHGAALHLRQCDSCKRIGIVDNFGETRWMEEKS